MQKRFDRSAGILMPVSSLPSPYGIGTFGKSAYDFVDNLAKARQKFWQVLPLGPTSYGDSPYASFSAFAGNPYFIDLDILIDENCLRKIMWTVSCGIWKTGMWIMVCFTNPDLKCCGQLFRTAVIRIPRSIRSF